MVASPLLKRPLMSNVNGPVSKDFLSHSKAAKHLAEFSPVGTPLNCCHEVK